MGINAFSYLINATDKNAEDTALHIAIRNKDIPIIKVLVANEAKINIKNNDDETPYDILRSIDEKDKKTREEIRDIIQGVKTKYETKQRQAHDDIIKYYILPFKN